MKATRRDFIKAATVTSGLMMTGVPAIAATETKPKQAQRIGVALELYSVRGDCAKDFDKTLAKVAAMGVTGVEFAGYFKYSNDAKGLKKQLDANGLRTAGTLAGAGGTFLGTADFQGDALKRNIEYAKTIGCEVLTHPGDGGFCNDAGNKQLADVFNKASEILKPEGMFCGYHNHAAEMALASGGKTWWEIFAERTSKDMVLHQDVSWIAHGGQDPVAMIRKFPQRTRVIHAKPFVKHGDKGKRDFVGHDSLDWKGIIAACYEVGGTKWFSVEQESYPEGKSAMQCSDISIQGLKAVLADTKYGKLYYE